MVLYYKCTSFSEHFICTDRTFMLTFFCLINKYIYIYIYIYIYFEFEVGFLSSFELIGLISCLVKSLFLSKYTNLFFARDFTLLVTRPYYRIGLFIAESVLRQVHNLFRS